MKIGDIVTEQPFVDSVDGIATEDRGPRKGRVVYIHPQGRFYTVEFTARNGQTWRECFYFPERRENPNASRSIDPGDGRRKFGSHGAFHRQTKLSKKDALYAY